MILTLRTLLAWLDDTASLTDCQQIGKMVEANPGVMQLVGRIYEVMHGDKYDTTVDYDLVTNYLDNQLDPAELAEFEARCLESDAILAEVTDTHRILSLIGKKVRVPMESKPRMYLLVGGGG